MFVITSDVSGAEVTRSHLPRGLHSALRLEHATQQVRKILRENSREKKNILDFSLRSRERSEARERAGAGDGRDTPKKSISMGQIQPGAGARQQDTNGNPGQSD